jgi:hypothetical protein
LAYYVRDDREVVTAHIDIPIENCFPNPVRWIISLNYSPIVKITKIFFLR